MNLLPRRGFFGDLFDDFFDIPLVTTNNIMKTDIYEEDNNYVVEMDIPGFKKEDVTVDYDKGYLTIRAKKETEVKEDKNYIKRERFYGEYKRSFYIGELDESSIKANFENGILKVAFPKKQLEHPSKKTITIE
ncbi:MAG: Hsp20/alpha crystallin family protein [Bacilli bacterium]|nr:Hsp20/alpha crystallin family protein [Bacilli bacterium]